MSHIEQTPAGPIDWKMEALRSARLLADAQRIIAEYKTQVIEAARRDALADELAAALNLVLHTQEGGQEHLNAEETLRRMLWDNKVAIIARLRATP